MFFSLPVHTSRPSRVATESRRVGCSRSRSVGGRLSVETLSLFINDNTVTLKTPTNNGSLSSDYVGERVL